MTTEQDLDTTAPAYSGTDRRRKPRTKKRAWLFPAIIVISIVLGGISYMARQADSWLIHLYRHQIVRELAPLQTRIVATGLAVSELGRVQYDGVWFPVQVVRRIQHDARSRLCVFSGVHGNEPASVEASVRFAESLGTDPSLFPGFNITIVPLVNPWGWARNLRRNGANQDISRTFFASPSPEAEMIKPLLRVEGCDIVIDLHGDHVKRPFYITTFDNANLAPARALAREIQARGVPLRMGAPDAVFNRRDKDAINNARPNLGLYARRHGVPQVYGVQTPRNADIEERVAMHLLTIDRLAKGGKK